MQQFEYLYTRAEFDWVTEINGKKQDGKESIPAYLYRAGLEGWELAGMVSASETGFSWKMIFKRPLGSV